MNIDTHLLLGYIDPGTGALVLQILFAAFVTIGMFGKRLLTAPLSFLRKSKSTDEANNDVDEIEKRAA